MIEARELRIGNWVNINGEILEISGIDLDINDEGWALFSTKKHELEEIRCQSIFKPIPLTEEWLVRFGFEKRKASNNTPNWLWWKSQSVWFHQSWETEKISITKFLPYDQKVGELYIHQLQNLYFALTGQELTIKS